jgi:tetratricopeptide (TPR) repeat protein
MRALPLGPLELLNKMLTLSRFIEFFVLFAASVGAIFYFSPQFNPRWRPFLKYAMVALVIVVALSELLVKDLTGKGWEDRVAHLVGEAFCTVIPQFSSCYDRAIAELDEALRKDPHNPVMLINRGTAYFGQGDFDRAIADFDEALRLNPELAAAYARRAYAYRAKGNDDRAVSDIQQASKLDPQFARAASDFIQASVVRVLNEERQKNEELTRVLGLEKARVVALNEQIERLRNPAKDVQARSSTQTQPAVRAPAAHVPVPTTAAPTAAPAPTPSNVASPDRDEVAALLTRARSYLSAGDVAAARMVLRQAVERDDAQAALALAGTYDPVLLRRLGIINFHSDPAQARDWYRKAAELGSADASRRLEQLGQTAR